MKFTQVITPIALASLALALSTEVTSTAVVSEDYTTFVTITSCGTKQCTATVSSAISTKVETATGSDEIVYATTTVPKSSSPASSSWVSTTEPTVAPASSLASLSSSSSEVITYVDITSTPTVTVNTQASTDVTVTPTIYTTYNSNSTYSTYNISQFEGDANRNGLGMVAFAAVGAYLVI